MFSKPLSIMGNLPKQPRRRRRYQPWIEGLEGRWVPHAGLGDLPAPSFGPSSGVSGSIENPTLGSNQPENVAIPILHSYASATAKLYLDFDGHQEASWGAYSDIDIPGFNIDGDPANFSSIEALRVEEIWRRVAEDFAPFALDVTTEEPASFSQTSHLRVAIGGDGAWTGGVNGGISYNGLFTDPIPNVVFVFPDSLGGGDARLVAETISHESGHAFGLEHQCLYDAEGNLVTEYNPGEGGRAPIMGNSLADNVRGLWWRGPNESSADSIQDDLAILGGSTNGFGWRPDDVGDTAEAARALQVNNAFVSGQGIIETMSDVDVWSFRTDEGVVLFQVTVPAGINNLDAKLALLDADGNEIIPWQDPEGNYDALLAATVPSGSYRVVVGSHGGYGDVGQYRISGVIVPAGSVLNPPTDLTATAIGASQIDLAWVDNADDESGYVVQMSRDGYSWNTIAEIEADRTSFASTGLDADTIYTFRVYADSSLADSYFSNEAAAETLAPPAAPTNLTATIAAADRIRLNWQDNAQTETAYVVQRAYGSDWLTIATLPADATEYDDAGLAGSMVYAYRVHALDGTAPSATSDIAVAETPATAPSAPSGLVATAIGASAINLSWNDVAGNESSYIVERSVNGAGWVTIAALPADSTSFQSNGLAALTTYYYRVRAISGDLSSGYSNIASAQTLMIRPQAPTNLRVLSTTSTTLSLTWIDRSNNETQFKVLRSTDGVTWTAVGSVAANVRILRTAKPPRGRTYYFKVVAVNAGGESLASNAVSVRYNSNYYRSALLSRYSR